MNPKFLTYHTWLFLHFLPYAYTLAHKRVFFNDILIVKIHKKRWSKCHLFLCISILTLLQGCIEDSFFQDVSIIIVMFYFFLPYTHTLSHNRVFFNDNMNKSRLSQYSRKQSLQVLHYTLLYFNSHSRKGVTRVTYMATFPTLYTYIIT